MTKGEIMSIEQINLNNTIKLKPFKCFCKGIAADQEFEVFDEFEDTTLGFNAYHALMKWFEIMYNNYFQYSFFSSVYGDCFNDFVNSEDLSLVIENCQNNEGTLKIKMSDYLHYELSVIHDDSIQFIDSKNRKKQLSTNLLNSLNNFGIKNILDNKIGVTDIAINKTNEFWFKIDKNWTKVSNDQITFDALMKFAENFAEYNEVSINFDNPICNGQIPFGYHCQIVIPPAVDNSVVAIAIAIK